MNLFYFMHHFLSYYLNKPIILYLVHLRGNIKSIFVITLFLRSFYRI